MPTFENVVMVKHAIARLRREHMRDFAESRNPYWAEEILKLNDAEVAFDKLREVNAAVDRQVTLMLEEV